jgi:hypothetical protein
MLLEDLPYLGFGVGKVSKYHGIFLHLVGDLDTRGKHPFCQSLGAESTFFHNTLGSRRIFPVCGKSGI